MKLKHIMIAVLAISLALPEPAAFAQRGGRGGGFRGGGMPRGGFGGGMPRGGMPHGGSGLPRGGFGGGLPMQRPGMGHMTVAQGPHGGGRFTPGPSRSRSFAGPGGGQYQAGSRSGSYTTQRGGTIDYGAAGFGGTGPGGTTAGRGVYGVQGTTAGGRSFTDVGRAGGAIGPEGTAVGGHSQVGAVSGPRGTAVGGSRSVGGLGPEGAFHASERGGIAAGPEGAVAAGSRGAVARRPSGTYHVASDAMAAHGAYHRGRFAGYGLFSPAWYARYPTAWTAALWTTPSVWAYSTWGAVAGYCGYAPQQPIYYDYGSNVVAQPDAVYVNGDPVGTPQQYAEQASQIAAAGTDAQPDPEGAWQPLGVFAVAPDDDEVPPNEFFQLAINPQGILRGNYHNTQTDTTQPVSGSVDPQTLRAAWIIGQQPSPVFEAGIANLTKHVTTMLVHDQGDMPQQVTLVRMPAPDAGDPSQQEAPPAQS